MTLVFEGKTLPLEVQEKGGRVRLSLSGRSLDFELGTHAKGGISILLDGCSYEAQVDLQDDRIAVELDGERYVFQIDDGDLAAGGRRSGEGGVAEVKAPMPGKVVKILAASGEQVEADQGVLLFEAMKMQNEIRSPMAGRVAEIEVQEGQAVESRERLFTIKAAGE
jgi:biotin carboxyl carrier protein